MQRKRISYHALGFYFFLLIPLCAALILGTLIVIISTQILYYENSIGLSRSEMINIYFWLVLIFSMGSMLFIEQLSYVPYVGDTGKSLVIKKRKKEETIAIKDIKYLLPCEIPLGGMEIHFVKPNKFGTYIKFIPTPTLSSKNSVWRNLQERIYEAHIQQGTKK